MNGRELRLGYLVSHPVQYQAPLLRQVAAQPGIRFKAYFLSDMSAGRYFDAGFQRPIEWDVPVTEGYDHEFLYRETAGREPSRLRNLPIEQALVRDRIDVLWQHGWAYATNVRALWRARRLGVKILMRGESNLMDAARPWKQAAKNAWLRWCFSRVDGFLCIGGLNRRFYSHYGVPESRLFDVPYAVDNEFFQRAVAEAAPRREGLRASLGLAPGRPVILFAGKLVPHKGALELLEAYRRLSPDGIAEPDPYLVFVGEGEQRPALEEAIRRTGWTSIRTAGFQNQTEIPRFFDLCDVFVLPSSFEPWGLVVNEVMNAGRPVLVSDRAGCAPDLVRDGGNGFVFPSGDVAALARQLRRVAADAGLRERMGRESLERIARWSFREDLDGLLRAAHGVML